MFTLYMYNNTNIMYKLRIYTIYDDYEYDLPTLAFIL